MLNGLFGSIAHDIGFLFGVHEVCLVLENYVLSALPARREERPRVHLIHPSQWVILLSRFCIRAEVDGDVITTCHLTATLDDEG